MSKSPRPWIVTRPTTLVRHEANLWSVESPVPGGEAITRRMSIVKRTDGKLVFLDAVPVDDEQLAQIRAFGEPAFLVLSHASHAMDAAPFREKLRLAAFCPERAIAKLRERLPVEPLEALPPDPALQFEPVGGCKTGEQWAVIRSDGGRVSIHSADAFMNVTTGGNWLTRLLGFCGGPRCVPVFKLFFVSDRHALRASYRSMIELPGLVRVIPCHGEVVESGGREALIQALGTI